MGETSRPLAQSRAAAWTSGDKTPTSVVAWAGGPHGWAGVRALERSGALVSPVRSAKAVAGLSAAAVSNLRLAMSCSSRLRPAVAGAPGGQSLAHRLVLVVLCRNSR
jgi:hypothetical protein